MVTASGLMRGEIGEAEVAGFHREGHYVARGLLSAEEIAEIRETFMQMAANGPVEGLSELRHGLLAYDAADPLAKYPRMLHPHRHMDKPVGPVAMKYMLDSRIESHLRSFMGEDPIAAQSMFYFKPPGARGQDFHQDNLYLRVKPGTCLAAWIAVDDCDEENGTMMVVPESKALEMLCPGQSDMTKSFTNHRVEIPKGMAVVTMNLKAGDVLYFNGSVIHGSYPNRSAARFRRSLICHYVPNSCVEVAHFYKPLLRFTGEVVEKVDATGGGPCGAMAEAKGPH